MPFVVITAAGRVKGSAPPKGFSVLSASGSVAAPVLTVPEGGTGVTSFTPYAVILGGTTPTGPLQDVGAVGTAGQLLTSNGAAMKPSWQDLDPDTVAQAGYWSSLTNGDPLAPELIFDGDGDTVAVWTET